MANENIPSFNDSITKKCILKTKETISKQSAKYNYIEEIDYEKTKATNT